MPDIAQPEVDLLNMAPRSNNSNNVKNSTNVPAKEASFDLLGSFETTETTAPASSAIPDLLSESQPKPSQGLDDLFGAFAPTNNNNTAAAAATTSNVSDLNNLGLNFNAPKAAPASNFDPFGNESAFIGNAELLRPTSTDTSPSSTQSKPPPSSTASANKDPFADIANLASGLNLGWGAQQSSSSGTATATSSKPTTVPSPHTTQFSSPTHQYGGFVPNPTSQGARSPMDGQPAAAPPLNSQKPDYNRSHFETKQKQNGAGASNISNGATGAAASGGGTGDIFADILGQQGYNFATKSQIGPRSINEMRKEELIKDMDPDKLRIMEWVSERKCLFVRFDCL